MKYSFSEPLNRNIMRHLRFQYPTFMLSTPQFEIDEEGQPWWIAPRIIKTIGLFGGTDIKGAVLCNAITGESQYYEEVPAWVDNVYTPELIMEQYDYHGTLINGFINSVLGQRDVTVTTQGYNYIALNDDVYMYTGVTSANADQSNLGFLLSNIIMLPLAIGYTSLFATAVLRMKREILSGIVIVLCVTGAFAVKNNIFNIYVIIAFGLIGYFFNKFHIPQSPLILASILGKMMESNWVQSMVFSHNNLAVFVTRPLSCALLVISLAFIVIPMIKSAKDKKKGVAKA